MFGIELAEHADAPVSLPHQRFDEGGDLAQGVQGFGGSGAVLVMLVFGDERVELSRGWRAAGHGGVGGRSGSASEIKEG